MHTDHEVDISMITVQVDGEGDVTLGCGTCAYPYWPPPENMGVPDWVEAAIAHVRAEHLTVIEAELCGDTGSRATVHPCSLPAGHDGDHQAQLPFGTLHSWPREAPTEVSALGDPHRTFVRHDGTTYTEAWWDNQW